jgi:dTDP-4-amino-4,6-dideoxygalactose transaminase
MAELRSHGIVREASRLKLESRGPWHHEQQMLGFNYRLTDLHAALGLSQLARLNGMVERRNALAQRYDRLLEALPVQRPTVAPGNLSAFHLYVVRLRLQSVARTHREVFDALRSAGIGVNLHYMPVHLQPYYRELGFVPGTCPEAERYAAEALTLPLYPTLEEPQQDAVVKALQELL